MYCRDRGPISDINDVVHVLAVTTELHWGFCVLRLASRLAP
jgi:hypothetical protein